MADAFGRMVSDYYRDELSAAPIHRRDDGETWDGVVGWYFAPASEWPALERRFVDRTAGLTLDGGCGPGRTALYLQRRGRTVVGLDRSPLALAVARARGLDHVVASDLEAPAVRGPFDSVVVLGGQLGATGSRYGLGKTLGELADVTADCGLLVADLLDPTAVEDPDRTAYLRARRIADGVSLRRFRVEYGDLVGPWIDLLCLAPSALRELVRSTSWRVDALERSGDRYYVALKLTPERG